MGAFVNNHVKHKEYVDRYGVNNNPFANNGYCGNDWASFAVFGTQSIFNLALSKVGDGRGGSGNTASVDGPKSEKETKKQIDAVQKEIDKTLKAVGLTSAEDFSSAILQSDSEINAINNTIGTISADIQNNKKIVDDAPMMIKQLETQITDENRASIQAQIDEINTQVENIKNKVLPELEKKLQEQKEQVHNAELLTAKGQVENYQQMIMELKGEALPEETDYNVKQESKDLHRFNKVLTSFPKNPTQKDVDKLIKAYNGDADNNESIVNQKHAKAAIDMLKKANPNLDWSALK